MTGMHGWVGKILRVDLTSGHVGEEDTAPYTPFVGGRGLGLKVVADEAPRARAFDESNRLVIASGPLTGTPAPASGRCTVVGVSPETYPKEQVTHSSIGGYFGAELKFAGYDAVIVQGRARTPVYLWVHDGQAELCSARELWGLDTFETQKELQKELGGETEVLCIGPAGENRVRVACIRHGTGHAFGSGGFGAVMGDKRLKAIAVHGEGRVTVARPKAFMGAIAYARSLVGTGAHWPLPTKGFWLHHQNPHDLSRQAHRTSYVLQRQPWIVERGFATVHKNTSCFGCPVACYNYIYVPKAGSAGGGDWQCAFPFGGARSQVTWQAKQLCDRLGINVYRVSQSARWLRWLVEQKRMSEQDIGLPISAYPNAAYATALINQIAYRQGIGALLGEGMGRAAGQLGLLDELMTEEALGYGGHGMSAHWGPRDWGMVMDLVWAMENRDPNRHDRPGFSASHYGWDPSGGILWKDVAPAIAEAHFGSEFAISPEGQRGPYHPAKACFAAFIHRRSCLKESLPLCDWQFPIYVSPLKERTPPYCGDLAVESQLYSAITGHDLDMGELDLVGERIWTLQRLITIQEWGTHDLRTEHDTIPERFFLHSGLVEAPIQRSEWERARSDYYQELGWNPSTGAPQAEALRRVGLGEQPRANSETAAIVE